jgi:hypothetical protein
MTIFGNNNSGNSNKKSWTQEDVKLAVGLKFSGASKAEIATQTGHPENSVQYLFTVKLKKYKDDIQGLCTAYNVNSKEDFVAYAQNAKAS